MVQKKCKPVAIGTKGQTVAGQVSEEPRDDDFLGKLAGTMKIVGDITEPIETAATWDALR